MELTIEPEMYSPTINDQGNYIDKVYYSKHGIFCPCGSRKDKIYESTEKFKQHMKTKAHQKWLADMNTNKANFYIKSIELEETVKQQRLIIAQLERMINTKSKTIDILTERLTPKHVPDLLTWD